MTRKRNVFILAMMVALIMAFSTFAQAFTYKDRVREPAMRTVMERINDEISSTAYNTTGERFYVDSGIGSDAASGTNEAPFATIDYAIGKCAANSGDIIFVYPGHAETIADAQITVDIAGISIIALGNGANRATLTMTHSNSSIDVTVANVTIRGLRLYSTTANSAIGIDLAAGADNFVLDRVSFTDTGGFEFTISVDLKTGADNVTISNSEFISASAGATASVNATTGAVDRLNILGNRFWTDASSAVIYSDQINTNCLIAGNVITNNNTGEFAIELSGATTGELIDNALYTDAWATMLDPGSLKCFGNTGAIAVDTNALPVPLGDYLSGGGTAPGQVLPASTSTYDVFGSFTGPYNGAAQDDNIKASLDLAHTDLDAILLDTGTTIPTTITTAQDDLDILTGATGANLLTATQASIDAIEVDTETTIPATITTAQNDLDIITGATGVNLLTATQATIDAILAAAGPTYGHTNYLAVATGTFDTTGVWSTATAHEIAVVTGMVRMTVIAQCVTTVASVSDTGTISLGDEVDVDSIIAASTLGAGLMAAGELWVDATLTRTIVTRTQLDAVEFVVAGGKDIGYTVDTNALSGGSMIFHIYWTPLDATGAVTAGAGGAF